ncbi:alpha/beta hydrolase [Roseomonas sp. NAR14]|uniref:Alpha/beta hydrolase n=1 Tax=Roseomonas acroporae TaxID=2937791 RepID=A0A9X1YAU7_9PROT|nr:alpha/beta hydrolase fold domain-containing protein [Roseomonas acroporae]MCK8787044.1 alpha/beta hydrolase [Roseomonas acroporae]
MAPSPATETMELTSRLSLRVRIHGRGTLPSTAPTMLHLHGGAFAGTLADGEAVARILAAAGAVVVSVDYPAGPAHPFPEALEAAYLALCQAPRQRGGTRRGGRLYVAGEEAGGNLAAALALMARDRREPPLAGQILLSPMLDPRLATASCRSAETGAIGCPLAEGWHAYLGSPDRACHPYAAPGGALRLAGVAPALLLTGPDDPLRDEAAAYAQRLAASGVPARLHRIAAPVAWPGLLVAPAATCPEAACPDTVRPGADSPLPWADEVRAAVAAFLDATARRVAARKPDAPEPLS